MKSFKIVKASTTFKIGESVSITVINSGPTVRLQVQAPQGVPIRRDGDERFRFVATSPPPQSTADDMMALAGL